MDPIINSSNYRNYLNTQVVTRNSLLYSGLYPSVQAFYGPYSSKAVAHMTVCAGFGDYESLSEVTDRSTCLLIPRGLTVAVIENNQMVEYQYKKPTPLVGYSIDDLELKVKSEGLDLSTKFSELEDSLGGISNNISDIQTTLDQVPKTFDDFTDAQKESLRGENGQPGVGIESVEQLITSQLSGNPNVIRINLSNGEHFDFTVNNGQRGESFTFDSLSEEDKQSLIGPAGVGIDSIEQTKTSTENGGLNEFTITLNNGETKKFTVANGDSRKTTYNLINAPTTGYTSGSLSALESLSVGHARANRMAFLPSNQIQLEYSQDSGASWIEYTNVSDVKKTGIFSETRQQTIYVGSETSGVGQTTTQMQTRITLWPTGNYGQDSYRERYCNLNRCLIWFTTSGHTVTCDIEASTTANKTTFTKIVQDVPLAGWSGWNVIYFPSRTFGGRDADATNGFAIRLVMKITKTSTSSTYQQVRPSFSDIRFFGTTVWTMPNNMMNYGDLYGWDEKQNMILPKDLLPKNTAQVIGSSSKYWQEAYISKITLASGKVIDKNTVIPTKTSQLSNDSNFITRSEAASLNTLPDKYKNYLDAQLSSLLESEAQTKFTVETTSTGLEFQADGNDTITATITVTTKFDGTNVDCGSISGWTSSSTGVYQKTITSGSCAAQEFSYTPESGDYEGITCTRSSEAKSLVIQYPAWYGYSTSNSVDDVNSVISQTTMTKIYANKSVSNYGLPSDNSNYRLWIVSRGSSTATQSGNSVCTTHTSKSVTSNSKTLSGYRVMISDLSGNITGLTLNIKV